MNLCSKLIVYKKPVDKRTENLLNCHGGKLCGLGCLFLYQMRMHTYLIGDDPAACINCHVMTPYYATWSHSSHFRDATCNDCHVPHQNVIKKYFFKGMDGMKHVGYFLTYSEHQAIRAEDASAEVIMDNCIRCHTQLNQEFVKTGRIDYMMANEVKVWPVGTVIVMCLMEA
jgi:cytochrome c nitrite reductase small subunit